MGPAIFWTTSTQPSITGSIFEAPHGATISGMLSIHKTHLADENPTPYPRDGRHYISVVFCRPAHPHLGQPASKGSWPEIETLDQHGRVVIGYRWFSLHKGCAASWYDWVAIEKVPTEFWLGKNAVLVMPDLCAERLRNFSFLQNEKKFQMSLKDLVTLFKLEASQRAESKGDMNNMGCLEMAVQKTSIASTEINFQVPHQEIFPTTSEIDAAMDGLKCLKLRGKGKGTAITLHAEIDPVDELLTTFSTMALKRKRDPDSEDDQLPRQKAFDDSYLTLAFHGR